MKKPATVGTNKDDAGCHDDEEGLQKKTKYSNNVKLPSCYFYK